MSHKIQKVTNLSGHLRAINNQLRGNVTADKVFDRYEISDWLLHWDMILAGFCINKLSFV